MVSGGNVEEGINQAARAGAVLNASWRHGARDRGGGSQPFSRFFTSYEQRGRVYERSLARGQGWARCHISYVIYVVSHSICS